MAAGEIKVSVMTFLETVPDNAKIYVVKEGDNTPYYTTKAALLSGIAGGATPTLAEVLTVGGREVKIVYASSGDYAVLESDKNKSIVLLGDEDMTVNYDVSLFSLGDEIQISNFVDGIVDINPTGGSSSYSTLVIGNKATAYILTTEVDSCIINYRGSGGGSQTLAQTLVNGNTTEGLNISISDGDAVALDNTSKLKKGTTNAGNGGNNGIALKCSLDYEFKWEAGRMYIMEQDGIGIRETRYNFNIAPGATDDSTKGYAVNSRWILDNGTMYECTDATSGNAIWENITVNSAPERLAKINASSVLGDGFNFHTFFSVGGALFGGERAGASVAPRFYKFSDPNDLSVSEFISMTFVGAGVNGFESMCYDANTDNFYGMLSNTTKIIRINATDITDYTISDISGHINFPAGCSFSGSGGICTDETHLYIGTEQIPNSFVLKVLISDLSVVDSYEWARPSIHAANINVTNGYCVFTTNGSDCYLLKVDLSDLSNVELQLNIDGLTDDFALASDFDWAFCGGEANIGASVGGVGIDLTTMTAYPMNCLPSTGFFYDAANSLVINTSLLGFVETYDIFNLIDAVSTGLPSQIDVVKTYTMRGFWVNEWAKVGSDYFVTTWENSTSGLIKKIELIEFKNPLITKEEVKSRFNEVSSGSATDLAYTPSPTNGIVTSSTGTDATLPLADGTNAGLLKPADFTQLSTLATDLANINTDAVDKVTVKLALGISKGQAVYISSANGTNIIVSKASNSSEATSSKTLGLLATTGVTNDIVEVVTSGLLDGLNTSTATIGDPVWLGTSGDLIYGLASKPVAPAHLVYIGVVSRVHATVGEIFVRVQNGFELKEIHDVLITSVVDNQVLNYDSASSLWKNKTLAKSDVGLGNVDNTSDANKPVSTATQTALDLKEVLSDVGRLSSDYTLSNVATAQKIFNIGSSGNGSFNALGSTLYEIELFVNLTSLSSTSGFFSFSLGGTATYTDLQLDLFATKSALISGSVFQGVITSASAFQCTTSNVNTVGTIKIKGLINVNGAGTIIPTITLSQASAGVVKKNSYFVFRKIGALSFTASSNII